MPAAPKGFDRRGAGQIPALEETISGLRTGLLLAIVAIFLLLMANFQSLRLPLAILSTIPGVLSGVVLMLLFTGTTLNIQSFMGAIMAVGISVANSILLVSFAEQARHQDQDVETATRTGATSRIRAILMTATAMICGMIPMAIGFGEGGAQSAPLGRAVIGGLIFSTLTTLTVLPAIYAIAASARLHHVQFTQSRRSIEPILCSSINASAFCFRWCVACLRSARALACGDG